VYDLRTLGIVSSNKFEVIVGIEGDDRVGYDGAQQKSVVGAVKGDALVIAPSDAPSFSDLT